MPVRATSADDLAYGIQALRTLVERLQAEVQAEETVRESERRYRQLFEMESDAVILVDCETHRYVDVN